MSADEYADALDRIVDPLSVVIGALVVLHGVGRYAGVIPAESAPAWIFIAIGLVIIAEVVLRD